VPEPLYRRIADSLQGQIESGTLQPGAKLPTELELREQHGASRNTVRDAIRWLTIRGLVETWPGQGTFVVQKAEPFVTTLSADPETGLGGGEGAAYMNEVRLHGRTPHASIPRVESLQAVGVVAQELQIPDGTSVVSRHQERFIDGAPFSLQTSYYPMSLVDVGAQRLLEAAPIEPGTSRYLEAALGFQQSRYRDTITVRAPSPSETTFFNLPASGRVSVFETLRTAFDNRDKPFRLTVSVYAADRNEFVVFCGVVPAEARKVTQSRAAHGVGARNA
jgi:GntR family transcriptional regulator